MLSEITIENVAVIEKASAAFSGGFTVLTGETGAGKSIMIDSINAILGNRTSRDIVRSGAQKAAIWASFADVAGDVQAKLRDAGYDCDGELLLTREVSAEGKSNCRINGMPATAAMLREICGGLVNIHGQHDNQSLLDPARHIGILDAFAQNEGPRAAYRKAYDELVAIRRETESLSMNEAEKTRKMDLLRYEAEEIEAAALEDGEEEEWQARRTAAANAQRILGALNNAYMALSGGDEDVGAATMLADAAREMTDAAGFLPEYGRHADVLNEAYYNVSEIASDIQNAVSSFEYGDESLEQIEERLDLIYRLKQKYGGSVAEVLAYGEKARQELENIEFSAERLAQLAAKKAEAEAAAAKLAAELTKTRQDAFGRLNKQIAEALGFLNMPGIAMALRCDNVPLGPNGQDDVEFYISTNAGETPKPLAKIASGGELARIMLALKSALADRDDVATVIYDEIDTGISGMAAGRIGQLLRDTAGGRQVICVTHTAQIAAYADCHLLIEKQVKDGRTYTGIRELTPKERMQELARIISGDKVTDIALANAREMLEMAGQSK